MGVDMDGESGERDKDRERHLALQYGLEYLESMQRPLLERLNHDNVDMDTLARYSTALMIEAAEFANEMPWKQWGSKEPSRAKILEEFVDLLHFIGTWTVLLRHYDITPEDIAEAFEQKNKINHARFNAKGIDSVPRELGT